ncbi:MAG: hypothetical protein QMD10_01310 [Desulfitobacteriaceae bacterium]|nr:hypothetical protein [Desulfitobacteriaceae bacterium]
MGLTIGSNPNSSFSQKLSSNFCNFIINPLTRKLKSTRITHHILRQSQLARDLHLFNKLIHALKQTAIRAENELLVQGEAMDGSHEPIPILVFGSCQFSPDTVT